MLRKKMTDQKHDAAGARPFQLRPSILSGSGFGSPFSSSGSTSDKAASKGFMLRPSALSSAADHLNKTDTRKRNLEDENENDIPKNEEAKKTKIEDEAPDSTSNNTKLTEDIQKPTGIGTFGFAAGVDENDSSSTNGNISDNKSSVNYFQNGLKTKSEKLGFVFGASSGTVASGFKSLQKDDYETDIDLSAKNESVNSENVTKEKLLENADEYEKTHNQRKHYEEVEQFTGEEGEQHVLQVVCKLHLFDKLKKTWQEKGRGTLRLNDICQAEGVFQSRLVFRTQGTNLVQLNTMLWMDMFCEKVKDKSIRITGVDPETQEVKVYLITTSLKDVVQTFTAIDRRIQALKRNHISHKNDDTPSSNESKNNRTDDDDSSTENDSLDNRARSGDATSGSKKEQDSS